MFPLAEEEILIVGCVYYHVFSDKLLLRPIVVPFWGGKLKGGYVLEKFNIGDNPFWDASSPFLFQGALRPSAYMEICSNSNYH